MFYIATARVATTIHWMDRPAKAKYSSGDPCGRHDNSQTLGSIFLRLPVATGAQDEALHRNGSLRCVIMRLRTMPRQVNVGVRRAIVVVKTRSIEYNRCASAGRRGLGCPFDLIRTNISSIDRCRPA